MNKLLGRTVTIDDIQSNNELRRDQFPAVARSVYFAHAGVCPLPRRVSQAIANYARACASGDQELAAPGGLVGEVRGLAARLLHVSPDEISLVGPTSLALSMVAGGLPFRRGDNVVIYSDDYPSNVYPWMTLANRGVEIRTLRVEELGRIRLADVLDKVDKNTRLVALASCHFVSGWRLDYAAIGRALRQRNIWFCLDGIQTLGAAPVAAGDVDFLAADAHKWLLGPCGAGLLYVRREMREILRPTVWGWNNIRCPDFIAQERMVLETDGRRYEAGSAGLLGLVGLKAALELVLELDPASIATELRRQREILVPALQAKGWHVRHAATPPENTSGILSFNRPGADAAALHSRLLEHGIVTSLRADRSGQRYVRLSPHCYNTSDELHRLLEVV